MCVVNDSNPCTNSRLQRWLEGSESVILINTIKNDQKIGRSDLKGNTISQLARFQSLQNKKVWNIRSFKSLTAFAQLTALILLHKSVIKRSVGENKQKKSTQKYRATATQNQP